MRTFIYAVSKYVRTYRKEALEKCIQYQNEIMELQDKYSKLQEEYIKLTHYVLDDDNNNDEINKIKIG